MSDRPLFLLATERSGSNLLRSILDAHSDISAPHPYGTGIIYTDNVAPPAEIPARKAYSLVRDILISKEHSRTANPVSLDQDAVFSRLDRDAGSPLSYEEAIYEEYAATDGSSYWCSKNPTLLKNVDAVLDYYDDPMFLYLVRDPRDVVLSFKNATVGDYHPVFTAERWRDEQANALAYCETHEDVFHLVTYEEILRSPEETVRALCDDIGVEFEDSMLEFYATDQAKQLSERSGDMHSNLGNPIQRDNYEKYKDQLPDDEIKLTEKIARDQMLALGYEPTYDKELLDVTIDREAALIVNRRTSGRKEREYWREEPIENLRSLLSTGFKRYIFLRYGLLEGRNITGR